MEKQGSKSVEVVGTGDKHQITAVFSGTIQGAFLPVQVIYAGKTRRCHTGNEFNKSETIKQVASNYGFDAPNANLNRKLTATSARDNLSTHNILAIERSNSETDEDIVCMCMCLINC